MTTVAEHLALLRSGRLPEQDGQMLTREINVEVDAGVVMVALDSDGRSHLLVPMGRDPVIPDRASRGVAVDERKLTTASGATRFVDLACLERRLEGPFEQLLEDVAGRLRASGSQPNLTILQALEDWRALLRVALHGLSRDVLLGLIGELEVMTRMAAHHPRAAIDGWRGPLGSSHDFVLGGRSLEVKATSAVSASSVRISNLDQLDPSFVEQLHLAVVHLRESAEAPDLDERIDDLIGLGVPAAKLLTLLESAGYVRGMDLGMPTRYAVRSIRLWRVDDGFPGLHQGVVPPETLSAIENVEYDLLLPGLPSPLPQAEADAVLNSWGAPS
ncbi:PD-(D/E)XK motif protein [Nocardioides taihuensis]|uniref:PD-(D/E)XK motif protein n=1 Tax=Nocardioides taihuensis TaxID=1835606 RepID=A0ABW0BLF7_9ACTN